MPAMLTQLATIKARLGLEQFDTTDDGVLTNLLRHVSGRFAIECNRIFDYGAALTHEFRAEQINIIVERTPIELVSRFELKPPKPKAGSNNPALTTCYLQKRR